MASRVDELAIWKFDVSIMERFELVVPRGATFLCVQMQRGQPRAWFEVCPGRDAETRQFVIRGTGNPYRKAPNEAYLGTYQDEADGVDYVWHLFELR